MELRAYTDADFALTEALETDPAVMRQLGGPVQRERLPRVHRIRLADPWWFVITEAPGGPGVGTIGIWDAEHDGEPIHETGWMVLPRHQGRGIASQALAMLVERARAEPRFSVVAARRRRATRAVARRGTADRPGLSSRRPSGAAARARRGRCRSWRSRRSPS